MKFSEIIRTIESEIQFEYIGGAISWCDKSFDNAWSNAINRFDACLTIAIERKDYRLAEIEGEYYKTTVADLLRRYKEHRRIDDTKEFLKGITANAKLEPSCRS